MGKRKLLIHPDGNDGVVLEEVFPRRLGERYCQRDKVFVTTEELRKALKIAENQKAK